jgi:hypothetical protein
MRGYAHGGIPIQYQSKWIERKYRFVHKLEEEYIIIMLVGG